MKLFQHLPRRTWFDNFLKYFASHRNRVSKYLIFYHLVTFDIVPWPMWAGERVKEKFRLILFRHKTRLPTLTVLWEHVFWIAPPQERKETGGEYFDNNFRNWQNWQRQMCSGISKLHTCDLGLAGVPIRLYANLLLDLPQNYTDYLQLACDWYFEALLIAFEKRLVTGCSTK